MYLASRIMEKRFLLIVSIDHFIPNRIKNEEHNKKLLSHFLENIENNSLHLSQEIPFLSNF